MPRGFLVKRLQKYSAPISYRVRRYSDEDRSDSSSDHDGADAAHHRLAPPPPTSPDSEFATFLVAAYRDANRSPSNTPVQSSEQPPMSPLRPLSALRSPFYLAGFDRLAVTQAVTPPRTSPATLAPPTSPHKKRLPTDSEPDQRSKAKAPKKSKAVRRLNFDEDKTSPVSGTIIRELSSDEEGMLVVRKGDIDPSFNVVEITEEAKAEIAKIENRIGDYICQLCKKVYDDAFGLAQHKCSRIVHVEYRCPECDKVFNCPANLASHRRWHKPRPPAAAKVPAPPRLLPAPDCSHSDNDSNGSNSPHPSDPAGAQNADEGQFECEQCGKKFKRQAYLRKHAATHGTSQSQVAEVSDASEPLGIFPCGRCNKIFRTSSARTKHSLANGCSIIASAQVPSPTTSPPLPQQPVDFSEKARPTPTEIFTCKYCSSTFFSSPGLTRHINKYHPSENRQVILLPMPVRATTQ